MALTLVCFVVALVWSACNVAGCTAAQQHRAGDIALEFTESAGKACAGGPVMACPWTEGWIPFRDCVAAQAVPCLGVELVGLVPSIVDLLSGRYAVQLTGAPVQSAYLAQAAACIEALPPPDVAMCGDRGLPECGGDAIAWCLDSAYEAAQSAAAASSL